MQKQDQKDFDEFNDISPRKKDPTIQVIYDYEKYYMELVNKYTPEIQLLKDMLERLRTEQCAFYDNYLPSISRKLEEDMGIDEEARKEWLNRLTRNMEHSFEMSETLIFDYMLKDMHEFKVAVREKLGIL